MFLCHTCSPTANRTCSTVVLGCGTTLTPCFRDRDTVSEEPSPLRNTVYCQQNNHHTHTKLHNNHKQLQLYNEHMMNKAQRCLNSRSASMHSERERERERKRERHTSHCSKLTVETTICSCFFLSFCV